MLEEIYELITFYLTNYSSFKEHTLYDIRYSEKLKHCSKEIDKLNDLLTKIKNKNTKSFATIMDINDPVLLKSYFSFLKTIIDKRIEQQLTVSQVARKSNIAELSIKRIENLQNIPTLLTCEKILFSLDLQHQTIAITE